MSSLNALRDLNDHLQYLIVTMKGYVKEIQRLKTPLTNSAYDIFFGNIEHLKSEIDEYKPLVDSVNNAFAELDKYLNMYGKIINENKFKFGLQGHLKKQLRNQEYINDLPPHIQEIVDEPIIPTPFENRGGKKKKQRRTRKRR